VFQCKHPIDTLWVENCTVTGGGLTFFQWNELTDFAYFNHNTIVNNKKNWLLGPYHRQLFVVNNIFINQNWVGEDTNITVSGSAPRRPFSSTIDVDSISSWDDVIVQPKYQIDETHYSPDLQLNRLKVFVSDNINYYDPILVDGYYNSSAYKLASFDALPSYLTWYYFNPPFPIRNVPGEWMNLRTQSFFAAYGPPNGGFVEKRTQTVNPGTLTPGIADTSVVTMMAQWNQNLWGDPRFPTAPDIVHSKYIFGDYDPETLPGIVNGVKSDSLTQNGAGIGKFTDLTENFGQSTYLSQIDGLPIGSLTWDNAQLTAYNSAYEWSQVYQKYLEDTTVPVIGVGTEPGIPPVFGLEQNYPNPFNPTTTIRYSLPHGSRVFLSVYNALGQQVAVLVNGDQEAGYQQVEFDGKTLASGVYFYRIQAGGYVQTKKLLLVR
jgi:hypothetical protein